MCKHYVIRDSNLPRKLFIAVHMYIQRKLRLSDGQVRKLARAAGKGEGLKLRLSAGQLAAGAGGIPVSLTAMQDKRVSAASSGKGVNLEFSPKQIASMKREGGFLGALLPLLARIAPALLKLTARHWRLNRGSRIRGSGPTQKNDWSRVATWSFERPRVEKKTLNNLNIEAAARKMKIRHWRGVFMRDDLPADGAQKRERGIVNLDSVEGAGTHWVAYDARPDWLLYFDSYGLPPPAELIHYLRARGRPLTPLEYSTFRVQTSEDGPICGYLCLRVLNDLSHSGSYLRVLMDIQKNPFPI